MNDRPTETTPVSAETEPTRRDRRTLLRTAGFVALAGGGGAALAACSSASTTSPATSAPASSATPSSEAPSSSAPSSASPSASSSASATKAAPTGPSAATSDVPVGGGTVLPDANYVITQPTQGQYKAFTSTCTHQGCKVAQVKDAKIVCNCHGSEFSITDGSVAQGPADEPLQEFQTEVSGSKVYVQA